jgi:inosose dehydratase
MPALPASQSVQDFSELPISCNTYNWDTFAWREGNKSWTENPEANLAQFKETGIKAIEFGLPNFDYAKRLMPLLRQNGIQMPSVYVNSTLHKPAEADKSIADVLEIAQYLKGHGVRIMVTNPSPIKWGGTEAKSDAEMREQAKNLEQLGAELRRLGITLAYHTHDTEMLAGAREFHHMFQNTSPKNVSFCFDTHWVFRGSQNSEAAVFDVLKMYGKRIVELHLRQSVGGVWSETFGKGDIDYQRFAKELHKMKIKPHLVIEQCVEEKSPKTMGVVEAHQINLGVVKELFGRK